MAKHFLSSMVALFLLNSVPTLIQVDPYPFYRQFFLPSPAFGPDSIAFARNNQDIAYVAVSDGRVFKLYVNNATFVDFAYTSPTRTKQVCDGNRDVRLAPICGKVFGLSADNANRILYAVDVNLGLYSINITRGGQATFITNTAGGQQFKLLTGLDVDPVFGDVYFTDASQTMDYGSITPVTTGVISDATGRLIRYNPTTQEVTVLLSGLAFPSGPAVSFDGTFVLIPQVGVKNIVQYYIRGPFANTSRVLLSLSPGGLPFKINRASTLGDFWVAIGEQDAQTSIATPFASKFNSFGTVLVNKSLSPQYPNNYVFDIQETNPFTFFAGSRFTNYITQYSVL